MTRAVTPLLLFLSAIGVAQQTKAAFPKEVTITRHTFFDFGPPFDFYEVIQLSERDHQTYVQRASVTPGEACLLPTKVEAKAATVDKPLRSILLEKNPCDIPEKDLKKERKRCKHCLTFSGVNVTLGLTCNDKERNIRADILDRDLFDNSPNTPENTSWTMKVLRQLDEVLGPGPMNKPIFASMDDEKPGAIDFPSPPILEGLKGGTYDAYFNSDKKLSQLYRESLDAPAPVSVVLTNTTLDPSLKLPTYPPIARAAQVEGTVEVSFDITPSGNTNNVEIIDGPKMLQGASSDAISRWIFPASSEVRHERLTFVYSLNCKRPNS
jgi:TonB family protein